MSIAVPNLHGAVMAYLNPPYIEACSTLAKSEIQISSIRDQEGYKTSYPVDNHVYFYFQNQTGDVLKEPKFYLTLSGYNGRSPYISKSAVLVSSSAAQQTSTITWIDRNVNISVSVLPRNATLFVEFLAWEAVDVRAEVVLEDEVEHFFQAADCKEDIAKFQLRNIEPIYSWVDSGCEKKSWGAWCPKPAVEGQIDVCAGDELSQTITVFAKGEHLHPYSSQVQFVSHPQLISEFLKTGIPVDLTDTLEVDDTGALVAVSPRIQLNVLEPELCGVEN
ncbi:hypothetical protein [uncultured Roseobacter sp.]|uniref:hypothetical protein n=1 Tax=uncultured Roseobacter sp. TaxID=114847 RepID=UPI0026305237|nr:hypothetical protein [uncultured Roseobacter sp.]